jgi:hypothetical protein
LKHVKASKSVSCFFRGYLGVGGDPDMALRFRDLGKVEVEPACDRGIGYRIP